MRALDLAKAVPFFVALACGGAEFTSADDASAPSGAAGSGTSGGSAGSSAGSGGSSGSAGSTGGVSGAGGSAGARDAGSDAKDGGGIGGGGGAGGGPKNSGDCQSASDCGGDPCIEVYPGGYRVCALKIPEATTCSTPPGQCCKSSDCATDARPPSKCIAGPAEPFCGGPAVLPTNICASDACTSAADCSGANAICAPAGTLGRRAARCMTGGCRVDRDCTAEPGGICSPVISSCCKDQVVGLFCIYSGGCRSNMDCEPSEHCQTDATHAFCTTGPALCPR